jgi:hypothetical protein
MTRKKRPDDPVDEDIKCLTNEELYRVDLAAEKVARLKYKRDAKANEKQALIIKKQLLDAQIKLSNFYIMEASDKIKTYEIKIEKLRQNHKKICDELTKKYDLGEDWGYDPETGEIVYSNK